MGERDEDDVEQRRWRVEPYGARWALVAPSGTVSRTYSLSDRVVAEQDADLLNAWRDAEARR